MQKPLSQSLVGKWNLDSMYMAVNVFGKDTVVGLPLQYAETMEFKSDLTYRDSTNNTGIKIGNWKLIDSTLQLGSQVGQTITIVQLDDVQLKTVFKANATNSTFFWYTRK